MEFSEHMLGFQSIIKPSMFAAPVTFQIDSLWAFLDATLIITIRLKKSVGMHVNPR